MKNYYIVKNETSVGPFSLDQLRNQGILPNTKVWCEGMPDWVEARMLPELIPLFPVFAASPPPIRTYKKNRHNKITPFGKTVLIASLLLVLILGYKIIVGQFLTVSTHAEFGNSNDNGTNNENTLAARNDELEKRKTYLRGQWRDLIKIEIIQASYKNFGGMSDVYVVAKNNMEYDVDFILFEADYILENGSIWKTRKFAIKNIPANGLSEWLQIEGSHRGKTIKFNLINVGCKAIGLNEELPVIY